LKMTGKRGNMYVHVGGGRQAWLHVCAGTEMPVENARAYASACIHTRTNMHTHTHAHTNTHTQHAGATLLAMTEDDMAVELVLPRSKVHGGTSRLAALHPYAHSASGHRLAVLVALLALAALAAHKHARIVCSCRLSKWLDFQMSILFFLHVRM